MAYTRRPLNPLLPFVNQVVVESDKINTNFDILANAFQGGDPATGIVLNADKVDDFHASQIPAPNTIPVALSNGKLDLGWLPDGIVNRRVDLTNATSDYDLQLGEEAYYVWDTELNASLPLRIKVSGMLYEMIVVVSERRNRPLSLTLLPNNMTYSSAFQVTLIYPNVFETSVNNMKIRSDSIYYPQVGGGGTLVSWLQTTTRNKGEKHFVSLHYSSESISYFMLGANRWDDTTTVWSSLGTLTINAPNGTIHVSIRRLL